MTLSVHNGGLTIEPTTPAAVVLLSETCWWIDRGDCWETLHYSTRAEAETDYADQIREDFGFPLSVEGALAIGQGTTRREHQRCREWTCPRCGSSSHNQERQAECGTGCGYTFVIEEIAPNERDQDRLFELPPTSTPLPASTAHDVLPPEKGDFA